MSNLIVIFGATGNQGGSVISSILAHPALSKEYKLRGITRDTSKPASQALAVKGVEMVSANMDDAASVHKAVEGAYGVFAVTDYWAVMSAEKEIQQGKNIVDAAKAAGVKHFVLSTLLGPKEFTNGALARVYHFDSKAAITAYARSSGLPLTSYLPGFYMSNLPGSMFRQGEDKTWTLALPVEEDSQFPLVDIAEDTGKYVAAIFANKDLVGKDVYGAQKYYTPGEIIDGFKKVYPGQSAQFISIPKEAFVDALEGQGMPNFAAVELMENMLLLNKEFGYYNKADLGESNKLIDGKATTWEEFAKKDKAFQGLQ